MKKIDPLILLVINAISDSISHFIQDQKNLSEPICFLLLDYHFDMPFPPAIGFCQQTEYQYLSKEGPLAAYNTPDMEYFSERPTPQMAIKWADSTSYDTANELVNKLAYEDKKQLIFDTYLTVCQKLSGIDFSNNLSLTKGFHILARDFSEGNEMRFLKELLSPARYSKLAIEVEDQEEHIALEMEKYLEESINEKIAIDEHYQNIDLSEVHENTEKLKILAVNYLVDQLDSIFLKQCSAIILPNDAAIGFDFSFIYTLSLASDDYEVRKHLLADQPKILLDCIEKFQFYTTPGTSKGPFENDFLQRDSAIEMIKQCYQDLAELIEKNSADKYSFQVPFYVGSMSLTVNQIVSELKQNHKHS